MLLMLKKQLLSLLKQALMLNKTGVLFEGIIAQPKVTIRDSISVQVFCYILKDLLTKLCTDQNLFLLLAPCLKL